MKTNINNLSILFVVWLFLTLGCGGSATSGNLPGDNPNERKNERGRLKFVVTATSIHTDTRSIYRNTTRRLYIDGKEWSPDGDKEFADQLDWCDSSPNPEVEVLRCFGTDFRSTYILRLKDNKPDLQKIDEGVGSVWLDDDGRWILFSKLYYNIETGEKIAVKGLTDSDSGGITSAPVQYVVGISPDKKTVVGILDSIPREEGAEKFLTLWLFDTETGSLEKRKVSFTKNPWLTDYKEREKDFQPPPVSSKKFVWKRGADGKDKLVVPQLLEKVER